jgi:hypothetical protein
LALPDLKYSSLDIFAAHRHQVGLDINVASMQATIVSGDAGGPQPALLNAIYLWACFLSRPGPLAQQEGPCFLETMRTLGEALQRRQSLDGHHPGIVPSCALLVRGWSHTIWIAAGTPL